MPDHATVPEIDKDFPPAHVEIITPDIAQYWLDNFNEVNRPWRAKRLRTYTQRMLDDEYMTNGETVIFDRDGYLMNGQHTLQACVESGRTIRKYVVRPQDGRGIDPVARITMDDPARRTFADDLHMHGVHNALPKAALTRKIAIWSQHGGFATVSKDETSRRVQGAVWDARHEEIESAISEAAQYDRISTSPGNVYFMWWLLRIQGGSAERVVRRFLSVLAIGSQDESDRVLVSLSAHFLDLTNSLHRSGGARRTGIAAEIYYLIRGWNAWHRGEGIGQKWQLPKGGLVNPYPEPIQATEEKTTGGNSK